MEEEYLRQGKLKKERFKKKAAPAVQVHVRKSKRRCPFILLITVSISFIVSFNGWADPLDIPQLTARVNDIPPLLLANYRADLEARLGRYEERTGHAIVIVALTNLEGQEITSFARKLFETRQLETKGSAGTILILISKREEEVAIETSRHFHRKFLEPETREKVQAAFKRSLAPNGGERGMETGVQTLMEVIDPWFSVLDAPSKASGLVPIFGTQVVALVIFILAPVLGLVTGFLLTISPPVGKLRSWARVVICGCAGSLVAVAMALVLRRLGGISLGILYYSAIAGSIASALTGGLSQFWLSERFTGRRKSEKISTPYIEG